MKYKSMLIFIPIFLFSCISLPDWTNRLPSDPNYYYGIGHSFTANQANDYQQAMAKARVDLARAISSQVKSQTDVFSSYDGANMKETYEQRLSQKVFSKLEKIEMVDSFHHRREGYWILIRLEKSEWEKLKNYETKKLESEIALKLNNMPNSFAGSLQIYFTIKKMLEESPFSNYAKIKEGSNEFFASAYIDNKILNKKSKFSYKIQDPEFIYITENGYSTINFLADSQTGQIIVKIKNGKGYISTAESDNLGNTQILIPAGRLSFGVNQLTYDFFVRVNGSEFLFESSTRNIEVKKVPVNLFINTNYNQNVDLGFIKSRLESTPNFPFDLFLNNDGFMSESSQYNMTINLNFNILPRAYYGAPVYAVAQIDVQLMRNGQLIFSYTKTRIQDGGADEATALYRTTDTALNTIIRDKSFIKKLYKDLGLEN
ncbi:MAG: LPP20 family lipoprotein [Spirochaetales bacterium]|nr:LPP20 family lipoprotein [Spirochaetales bacterium]